MVADRKVSVAVTAGCGTGFSDFAVGRRSLGSKTKLLIEGDDVRRLKRPAFIEDNIFVRDSSPRLLPILGTDEVFDDARPHFDLLPRGEGTVISFRFGAKNYFLADDFAPFSKIFFKTAVSTSANLLMYRQPLPVSCLPNCFNSRA